MFARTFALALALLSASSCGDRRLDLALELAPDSCNLPIPAGGSLLYQLTADRGDGGTQSFCGGCLAVSAPLADAAGILAFLRSNAPPCNGVPPNTRLRVALTAFSAPACPAPASRVFCSESPAAPIPDGSSDAVLSVVLTCDATCSSGCKPTSCIALGRDCGMVSDGCGAMLPCGSCSPPEVCGGRNGSGTPGVCSK